MLAATLSAVGNVPADLIGHDLAGGETGGYRFGLAPTSAGYRMEAWPVTLGVTGSRTYYADQTMVVRQNFGPEPATAASPPVR